MKKLCIALLLLAMGNYGFATEWGWYYVYIQTDYPQGPWSGSEILEHTGNYNYLEARSYSDLFGSDAGEMASIIFKRLQKEDSARFTFTSSLVLSGDTVIIKTNNMIDSFDAVKNELIATFTFNSFKAVKIIQGNQTDLFQRKDISVPYMDLVLPGEKN